MTVNQFNTRYEGMREYLFGFAMTMTKNHDRSADLMQETVLRAFRAKEQYRENTNFKAWITTIMRNTFINQYRKQKTRRHINDDAEKIDFSRNYVTNKDIAVSSLTLQELHAMLADLPDIYQVPFTMFYRGYQYAEIAEHLELPLGTVKSRIYFARQKMKAKIEDKFGDEIRR